MSELIELKDAVDAELERMEALAKLLVHVQDDLDAGTARGIGLLLRDVVERLRGRPGAAGK